MGATAISGEEPAMLLRPVVRNGRPGLIGRIAGATVVVGLSRRQQAEARQAAAGQPAAGADPIAQLKELAALKKQGLPTEEEFTAQKAHLLGMTPGMTYRPGSPGSVVRCAAHRSSTGHCLAHRAVAMA